VGLALYHNPAILASKTAVTSESSALSRNRLFFFSPSSTISPLEFSTRPRYLLIVSVPPPLPTYLLPRLVRVTFPPSSPLHIHETTAFLLHLRHPTLPCTPHPTQYDKPLPTICALRDKPQSVSLMYFCISPATLNFMYSICRYCSPLAQRRFWFACEILT
jgi:hypothetical protein